MGMGRLVGRSLWGFVWVEVVDLEIWKDDVCGILWMMFMSSGRVFWGLLLWRYLSLLYS